MRNTIESFRTTLPVPCTAGPGTRSTCCSRSRSRQRKGPRIAFRGADCTAEAGDRQGSRELYGSQSDRKARLLEQMELQLEELETNAGKDELAAEIAAKASIVKAFERRRLSRKSFPEHLPRERVIIAAPANCACCGSTKLSKLGEGITEALEMVPRQWKAIQTVREKFTSRQCEKTQRDATRICRAEPAGDDPV